MLGSVRPVKYNSSTIGQLLYMQYNTSRRRQSYLYSTSSSNMRCRFKKKNGAENYMNESVHETKAHTNMLPDTARVFQR